MKLSKILLYIYFFLSVLCIYTNFTQNENLFMISKTAICPVILFYYFDKAEKINSWFLVSILCFYFVDIVTIINLTNEMLCIIPLSLISHFILLGFAISDNYKIEFRPKIVSSSLFVFVCLVTTLSLILSSISENEMGLLFLMFFLGLLITILTAFVVYNYLNSISKSNFYLLISCICFIFSGGFYVIYKMIYYNLFIDCFTTIMKLASYLFLVQYILSREIEQITIKQ
jgi:hypothetical protein